MFEEKIKRSFRMKPEHVKWNFRGERKEMKIEAALFFYERMNRNQRVTRVVHIMREHFNSTEKIYI